ncbi:hypothetical protein B0182_09525 [Moraxella bovis]|uniref:Multidrug efflux system protein EmrA n=1 Tax=Moraxella bovis TaxID=476 RepID=A0A1S9ZYZ9_MORBO|nr:HlyD family secretion protein [Moraxella bovis]OOR88726.1 hypothetical protein B0182_09525 [Moraxella bovis]STY90785.1 multidrug efflux system protein EmrA [Moraxella bovis]
MTQSTPIQNEEPQTNPNEPQTWQPKKKSPLKKLLVLGLLLSGVMGILYAYQLPPFSPNYIETNNAYIRGKATVISPKVGGYVKEILVQDYEWVEAGQPLVQIETEQYEMKVAQASAGVLAQETALQKIKQAQTSAVANIAVMDANISSAQATLANAQAQFGRMAELIKIDAVSRQAYDDAQTNVKKAQSALAQAIAQKKASEQQAIDVKVNEKSNLVAIDNAKAGLELAKLDLEQTLIKSPISGQLGEITAKTGQLVAVGTNLMTVVPPDYWLIANVKETEIAQIGIGSLAHIEMDALGGKTILTGKVTQIAPATGSEFSTAKTDPSTGNFIKIAQRIPVKIEFDPNQSAVKNVSMGMSAVVKIDKVNEVAVK